MDVATFRSVNPQFQDLIAFPPEAITYWISVATARLDPLRWDGLLDEGITLFVSHKLALNTAAGRSGQGSVVSSKSVGGVSIAYNTELGIVANGGAYNLTTYGREFLMLARTVGIGGLQL
ncbi:MAG: hypothetical protein NVS2B11_03450 [Acetobacteraceae bacterium]